MTPSEFNRWWEDTKIRWPSVGSWFAKCFANDEQNQVEFLRNWRSVMIDVKLADAIEVNRLMQAGELSWVGEYDSDKERLPQHVRRLARTIRAERQPREQEPLPELKPSSFPAGKILRRILELVARGTPLDEAKAIALKEFPVGKPTWEPRYHCHLCRDVGNVTVASPTAIQAMLAGVFDACHHREASVRCKCRGHLSQNPKRTICIYDADLDFIVHDSLWPVEQVEAFGKWCELKRDEFWNSKRDSSFDAFNRREFV